MVKFNKHLQSRKVSKWAKDYIDYKSLKQIINEIYIKLRISESQPQKKNEDKNLFEPKPMFSIENPQFSVTPDKPKVLEGERVYVYVPRATLDTPGIASYDSKDFILNNGKVHLAKDINEEIEKHNTKKTLHFANLFIYPALFKNLSCHFTINCTFRNTSIFTKLFLLPCSIFRPVTFKEANF